MLLDQDAVGLASDDSAGWAAETIRLLGGAPDVVFTSERYGERWAKAMGCEHVLVDRRRRTVPISGTRIRRDPIANLRFLAAAPARTTSSACACSEPRARARRRSPAHSPSTTARSGIRSTAMYSWFRERDANDWSSWTTAEFIQIARMQNWYEDFLAEQANGVLFCDTNAWTTGLFHEIYLRRALVRSRRARGPRVRPLRRLRPGDAVRAGRARNAHRRAPSPAMHEAYLAHLREIGAPFVVVSGSHAERMGQATAAVDALLRGGPLCRKASTWSSSRTRSRRHEPK